MESAIETLRRYNARMASVLNVELRFAMWASLGIVIGFVLRWGISIVRASRDANRKREERQNIRVKQEGDH